MYVFVLWTNDFAKWKRKMEPTIIKRGISAYRTDCLKKQQHQFTSQKEILVRFEPQKLHLNDHRHSSRNNWATDIHVKWWLRKSNKHISQRWRRLPMFLFWLKTCYPSDMDSLFNNKCNIIAAGLYEHRGIMTRRYSLKMVAFSYACSHF